MSAGHSYQAVSLLIVDQEEQGQRIDNFLIRKYNKLPKSRVYRMIRAGEVRVNKKRVKVAYRIQTGDQIRVPPLFLPKTEPKLPPRQAFLEELASRIIYDESGVMALNKPSGVAVHGGSGVQLGVIEGLRHLFSPLNLELVHRLDRETSGCLLIAKKRSILRSLHQQFTARAVEKLYLALVAGQWKHPETFLVDAPLRKNVLASGERVVRVDLEGKPSQSEFRLVEQFEDAALLCIQLHTGRTHQIRVHAAHIGHPLAGDLKYGDAAFNADMKQFGLKRLFLHASEINFKLPSSKRSIRVVAPLDDELEQCLQKLRRKTNRTAS